MDERNKILKNGGVDLSSCLYTVSRKRDPDFIDCNFKKDVETECETIVYSKQFDKRLTNCFTTGI